ncbi:MAG: DUF4832 domain-containing protein, partial [Bifidobacteriaceae bacterium]|nr:DUF4832 domain-containing protein [Bifidobacteriaceae bacterium]
MHEDLTSIANPGRGWYMEVPSDSRSGFATLAAQGVNVSLMTVNLKSFTSSAISAAKLAEVRTAFAAARQHGISVVFRAAYDFSGKSKPEPTSLSRIESHIAQFAPVFAENEDLLLAIQAGFLGPWGEWHSSRFGDPPSLDAQRAVVEALAAAAPVSIPIQVRRPMFIRGILGGQTLRPDQAFDGSLASRLGYHDDCLASDQRDVGTYVDPQYTRTAELAWANNHLIATPFAAESCAMSSYSDAPNILNELEQLHAQTLNLDYYPGVIAKWRKSTWSGSNVFDTIARSLGYRFVGTGVGVASQAHAGGALRVRLDLQNKGFGNLLQRHDVEIVLTSGSQTYVAPVDVDPRSWRKEAGLLTYDWYFSLPSDLAAGQWTVSLALPSSYPALRSRPAFAIRLANVGTWMAGEGRNVLATVPISGVTGHKVARFAQISAAEAAALNVPTPTPTPTP